MGDSDEVMSLTPLVMTLPGVASVISCSPPACPFAAAKLLVKGVSKTFSESQVKIFTISIMITFIRRTLMYIITNKYYFCN